MQPRPYTNNEQIGRHEQEQTRTDTKRRMSISVKEERKNYLRYQANKEHCYIGQHN